MGIRLSTHAEIQAHVTNRKNLALLMDAVKKREFGGGKKLSNKEAHIDAGVNRLLIKAAYGRHAFRGTTGRALKAIAEERPVYKATPEKLRKIGEHLLKASKRLRWAALGLADETFPGFTERQQLDRHHYLGRRVDYLMSKGEYMTTFGKWRPSSYSQPERTMPIRRRTK